jgi:L-alanine-DL-glutamate epimerase-like enolase superfamily enzyme
MRIALIEATPFRLRPRRDFKRAGLQIQLGGFILVRIRTDDGLAPCLVGQDPLNITAGCARMNRAAVGHTYASCAIGREDDVVTARFAIRDGTLLPRDKPGLGIAIDQANLARFIDA